MRNNRIRIAISALLALAATTGVFAGGPIYTYDPENKIPYVWHMETWPDGAVPYFTDLGALGRLSNSVADQLVFRSFNEWNDVPTSSLQTIIGGDFQVLGLPDIVCPNASACNANLVIGADNGGGIHVIYDTDGRILNNYLGVFGALGVSAIEIVDEDSNEILEAWTVLNGPSVQSTDPAGERFRGVMTHELGHTVNLSHSQANGFVFQFLDTPGATGCALPYAGGPTNSQIETMYPFINVGAAATGTGLGMATVDRIDDIAAISDLYPAAGWPASHATIRGTVSSLLNIRGNGTGNAQEVTGVNVIARNVADPFNDFSSYLTGQISKGQVGADGEYVFHGLTPGASYVVYVDNARNGAFSVPRLIVLPGPEEYYNGAAESGNGETDNRCAYSPLSAPAGGTVVADMTFNRVKGAPEFLPAPVLGSPTDVTPDGSMAVITIGGTAGVVKWNLTDNSWTDIGGGADGGQASISDDGSRIAFSTRVNGLIYPAVYENGVWTTLPLRPGITTPCGSSFGSSYDISGDGQTVVGLSWGNGCANATTKGFVYKNGVIQALTKSPDSPTRANRGNAVSYDGTLIAGWDDAATGLRRGAYWTILGDGTVSPATLIQPDPNAFAGEGLEVCRDGSSIVGLRSRPDSSPTAVMPAWHYDFPGGLQTYPNIPGATSGSAICLSDDNRIVGGYSEVPTNPPFPGTTRIPAIYTAGMGWTNLNTFMNAQGTYAQDIAIANPLAMSADGKMMIGWAQSSFGTAGWALWYPKSVVCHANPGNPSNMHTIDVTFPDGLGEHLAHGDTLGLCETGGE